MLQVILITGCLVAVSHAFVSPMGVYTGAGGLSIDFNMFRSSPKALEGICNAAVMQNGGRATDALSDVMRSAVDFFTTSLGATGNPTLLGSGSPQWTCLLQASTANGMNPGNAANGVGDYYDTVVELPINHLLPFAFNPCSMVFCGEQGMTPMAIAMEVSRRLQFRQPLGNLANYFGSHANMLNQPQPLPGPGAGLAGMMQATKGVPAGAQNPLAQMSSLLAKMQSPMGNPGSPNPNPNPNPAGGAPASPAANQQPPVPISSPDAAAAGGTSATGTKAAFPSGGGGSAPTNGFMDMILKMQQMMKGGAAPNSPAAASNPFASMMSGLSSMMGGMPNMMGGMPNMMGGMPNMMGGMPNMMGGMPNLMGGMPSLMGGMPNTMGGMPNGMGGLMSMMAMNAAMQDAPDPVPGASPFGGMAALGGMPFSGMTGVSASAGTAGGSPAGLTG